MNSENKEKSGESFLSSLVPDGTTSENPFPCGMEDLNEAFLASAPPGEPGIAEVRAHADASFLKKQGQWGPILEHDLAAKKRELQENRSGSETALQKEKETPVSIKAAKESFEIPPGRTRWGVYGLMFAYLALAVLGALNLARFAVTETQGWFSAILYVVPLVFIPIGAEWVYRRARGDVHAIATLALVILGISSLAVFMWSFAGRFGFTPSPDQLERHPSLAFVALDMRAQIISQVCLEIVLGLAIFHWLRELTRVTDGDVDNPNYKLAKERVAEHENSGRRIEHEIGQLEGLLVQWQQSQEAFRQLAIGLWRILENDREQEARIRAERESYWRVQEQSRQHRAAGWPKQFVNGSNRQTQN